MFLVVEKRFSFFFACGALAVVLIDWREKKVLGVGVLSVVVIKKEARSMVRAVRT